MPPFELQEFDLPQVVHLPAVYPKEFLSERLRIIRAPLLQTITEEVLYSV